jgi:S-adenosylmethionine:tRNA ribosyltransferase-isomerase
VSATLAFELPERLEAHAPAEERDAVRMLVARRGDESIDHEPFRSLVDVLDPGDLLVVNVSRTLPAALPVGSGELRLHLSTPLPGGPPRRWVVELRRGASPYGGGRTGDELVLPAGARARLRAPYLGGRRLWVADLDLPEPLLDYLARFGSPIRYRYVRGERPLSDYQTVFAAEPGSAEMPSAGRPFTPQLVTALVARGIAVAPVVLHTGVSSLEDGEPPYPERFRVPSATGRQVETTRAAGGRVIAVGTTTVRALESAVQPDGSLAAASGWTRLVVTPETGVRAVDGLLTGWHEPQSSHLRLLEAVGGRDLVERAYAAALAHGYLWHEFGDVHLILP